MKKVIILFGICFIISILLFSGGNLIDSFVAALPKAIGIAFICVVVSELKPKNKQKKKHEDYDEDKKE